MTKTKEEIEGELYNDTFANQPIMGYTVYFNGSYWFSLSQDIPRTKFYNVYLCPGSEQVQLVDLKTKIDDFKINGGIYIQITDGTNTENYKCSIVKTEEDEETGAFVITCSHKYKVTDDETPSGILLFISPSNNLLGVMYGKEQAPGKAMMVGVDVYNKLAQEFCTDGTNMF